MNNACMNLSFHAMPFVPRYPANAGAAGASGSAGATYPRFASAAAGSVRAPSPPQSSPPLPPGDSFPWYSQPQQQQPRSPPAEWLALASTIALANPLVGQAYASMPMPVSGMQLQR
mmetsp:Transcript_43289/g.94748  ORF Transcript_43289/g.94748 Transcript_43289/m.94748 type:complete len:116 (-) Transcript_43289:478-825(-)|eukprot:6173661-Pleurochrysis_carterae.AAC.1